MKKFLVVLFLLALSTFVLAQESKWTVSILSGGTINSNAIVEHPYDWYPSYSLERKIKESPISSIDLNLSVTERYGFHFSYLYYPLNSVVIEPWNGWSEWKEKQWKYKSYVSMWEAGPEWDFNVLKRWSVYLQLNTGRCLIDNANKYDRNFRFNGSWMLGAAVGVRYFFTPNIGISAQAAYHYIDEWDFRNLWDARAGVSFRFKGEDSAIKAKRFSSDNLEKSVSDLDSRWMLSILPGYTLNEQRREYKLWSEPYSICLERSPSWSFDVNYNAKEHFGIHGSYIYLYARNYETEPFPGYPYDEGYSRKASYSLLEIGPEWRIQPFHKGQVYAQLNLGKSFVHTVANKADFNYWTQDSWYHSGWTFGIAGGVRYFFTPNIGGAVQLAWHRMNKWEFKDIVDARAGIVMRFNRKTELNEASSGSDRRTVVHRWTLSMLPGYTLNEISYQKSRNFPYHYTEPLITTKKASLLSMDLSVAATNHFGFHTAYLFHKARYLETYTFWYDPPVSFLANTNIHLWEVGPEWTFRPFEKCELYLQVNAGKTSIISSEMRRWPYLHLFKDTWSVGATTGARYFFMPGAGIAAQISCHHFADWGYSPLWDARAGVVFRF
jgi:hypothetical protein